MNTTRRSLLACATATAASLIAGPTLALGANYPDRPIKIVVGYPAGGTGDMVGRMIADHYAAKLGQPVLVENKPGAGSTIAATTVARASADGYTLLLSTSSDSTTSPLRMKDKLQYNVARDLVPVSLLVLVPSVLTVPANSPFKSVGELVRYAKANPDKLSFASFGNGTSAHVAAEMLKSMAGIEATHVPYRGSPDAVLGLIGGDVDFFFDTVVSALPQTRAGKVRMLAVSTATRVPIAPDVPTLQEEGIEGFLSGSFIGVSAPAGTPAEIVERLQNETIALSKVPAVRQKLVDMGMIPQGSTSEEYGKFIVEETARISTLIEAGKLSL
jgi:tripartite-type tricarboxylate transporter receptor subunit TctC